MAKGAQDWIARTDILLQTLSELIIRNKYGAYQLSSSYYLFLSIQEKTLVDISGKGIIYGGVIRCAGVSGSKSDRVKLEIDGVDTVYSDFENYKDWNIVIPGARPLFITRYDLVIDYFAVSISPGITFETSVKLIYDCKTAGPYVYWDFHYATI
uniref:Uncharacterized protein n=1 Tax=viral metagenome TaxID=1070528 RepID=A0A6H1ZVD7_9ZZZZ